MLYYVPIEPLNERYSGQWYEEFPKMFKTILGEKEVITIDGDPLTDEIKTGAFLDTNSTLHYKSSQLQSIAQEFYYGRVKNGDIFFIADMEFWGVESIKYLADLQNIKIFLVGIMHAGSYTTEDYMSKCSRYGKHFERGWFEAFDRIIFASDYHRHKALKIRNMRHCYDKSYVIPNPLFPDQYKGESIPFLEKKQRIIISNRFDYEKRPNLSLDICQILKERFPELEIIVTTSRKELSSNQKWLLEYANTLEKRGILKIYDGLSKDEYHFLLNNSKIMLSNSIEENFGYCIAEALLYGTVPIAFNGYSHPEFFDDFNIDPTPYLYNDLDDCLEKITKILSNEDDQKDITRISKFFRDYTHLSNIYVGYRKFFGGLK